ncbi:MAG: hypothetical protein QOG21_1189, partial [Actinomycetota bacterium]|nr:hypothetical protein [Actinomycetota bacterium]
MQNQNQNHQHLSDRRDVIAEIRGRSERDRIAEIRGRSERDLVEGIAHLQADICARQRELLSFVAEYDRRRLWQRDGCR